MIKTTREKYLGSRVSELMGHGWLTSLLPGCGEAGLFLNDSQEGVRRESMSLPTRQHHLHSGSLFPLRLQDHMPIVFTNILIGIPRQ